MGCRSPASSSSSSGEEDGDAEWRAKIDSVAAVDSSSTKANNPKRDDTEQENKRSNPAPKLYQIKAQKLLDDLVGKSLELVQSPIPPTDNDHTDTNHKSDGGGIRLFRKAPPGIILDPIGPSQPRKKPRLIPGEEIDEKSKKFRRQVQSVAVDGVDIMVAATDACQKSLARFEAKEAAAKAKAKKEEERVAELKKIRGEKWLPSVGRDMQGGNLNAKGMGNGILGVIPKLD